MPDHETLSLDNTQWVRVEQSPDKFCLLTGAKTLFLQDTEKGAVVQGVDKDGVATIFRFRGAKADDLTIKAALSDPLKPAGIYLPSNPPATQTEAAATK